jgi:hypothetical protein
MNVYRIFWMRPTMILKVFRRRRRRRRKRQTSNHDIKDEMKLHTSSFKFVPKF